MKDRHLATLTTVAAALQSRDEVLTIHPELPSRGAYGENAKAEGQQAFDAHLNSQFLLPAYPTHSDHVMGAEESPFTRKALGIEYPRFEPEELVQAALHASRTWREADADVRVEICLEIIEALKARSFEMANAVMHTTGQAFMMAFQAGSPHALDRAAESVEIARQLMNDCPSEATWTKRVSKTETAVVRKQFRIIPRGVSALLGCSTFPTWNGYPGLFASLATGNPVIVKPHPATILPLAIAVQVAQEVLSAHGFDPNLVGLLVDTPDNPLGTDLVSQSAVKIVDFTGRQETARILQEAAGDETLFFKECGGINSIIIDSVHNMEVAAKNIASSICLYSGQMCTTPQNILIPKGGVRTDEGNLSYDDVCSAISQEVENLCTSENGPHILGAIQCEKTLELAHTFTVDWEGWTKVGPFLLTCPDFPKARICGPLILNISHDDVLRIQPLKQEYFGPVAFFIKTQNTTHSIALAQSSAIHHGALTCSLYSLDGDVIHEAEDAMAVAGVPLSCNFTGQVFVNQSWAFSDLHGVTENPAGNCRFGDPSFVAPRFWVSQSRHCQASVFAS